MALDFDALVLGPCMDAFAQPVSYTAQSGQRVAIVGVFDRYHVEVSFDGTGAPVSTTLPVLGLREAAFPAGMCAAQGDIVSIAGTHYEITDTQPDGHGHVLLMLKLA
jgi:hypothetical protein